MMLSISAVVLLTVVVVILVRNCALKPSYAIACALWGFMLAASQVAPMIRNGLDSVLRLISGA